MEQHNQEFLENLVKHTQIFRNFLPGISVPLLEIQQFPALPKTSQKIAKPFVPVLEFKGVLVEWKASRFILNLKFFEELPF